MLYSWLILAVDYLWPVNSYATWRFKGYKYVVARIYLGAILPQSWLVDVIAALILWWHVPFPSFFTPLSRKLTSLRKHSAVITAPILLSLSADY